MRLERSLGFMGLRHSPQRLEDTLGSGQELAGEGRGLSLAIGRGTQTHGRCPVMLRGLVRQIVSGVVSSGQEQVAPCAFQDRLKMLGSFGAERHRPFQTWLGVMFQNTLKSSQETSANRLEVVGHVGRTLQMETR